MKLWQVEYVDPDGRYRAVQFEPGEPPPSLERGEAEEFECIVRQAIGAVTRIVPAPKGSTRASLDDLRERFSK